uniref:Or22b_0 protein n=1 Tax=Fopius arisanus TaxID=64838 RepID=A0A0C9R8L8_9HYME
MSSVFHNCEFNSSRNVSISSFAYFMVALLYYSFEALMESFPERRLPVASWLPYDYSSITSWWFSSVYLLFAMIVGGLITVGFNVLFFEVMMQIVAQVKILKNRLAKMIDTLQEADGRKNNSDERLQECRLFRRCVEYHIDILRIAKETNGIFAAIVLIQYSITSLVLCSTIYLMSGATTSTGHFLKFGAYFGCMCHQILILCYAGHYTFLEFSSIRDVLYSSDWTELSIINKQSLRLMLVNAEKPLVFDCGGILQLDVEALKNVLKLAYSIYNIL